MTLRRLLPLLLALGVTSCGFIGTAEARKAARPHAVKGYFRKDGTYVRPHMRGGGFKSGGTLRSPAVIPSDPTAIYAPPTPAVAALKIDIERDTQGFAVEANSQQAQAMRQAAQREDALEASQQREYQAMLREAQQRQRQFEQQQKTAPTKAPTVAPTLPAITPTPKATPVPTVTPVQPVTQSSSLAAPLAMVALAGGGWLALFAYNMRSRK